MQFAQRAFRSPLSDDLKRFYVQQRFDETADLETAVKRVVLLVLKSPRFLYRDIGPIPQEGTEGALGEGDVQDSGARTMDPYIVASRLSFGLCDSLPDKELGKSAESGALVTRDQVIQHAERLLTDARCRSKLRDFFLQWLKVDHTPDLAKDSEHFPGFDEELASDLRTSLEMSLEHSMWSDASDFREILLDDTLFLNGRLAQFYGADLAPDAPFQMVVLPRGERAGVLTHPYLMATFAYTRSSSPIHRGVFLARTVLGRALKPPPEAFTPLPPELHPNLTTRERVLLQTKPDACAKCHGMINPLGFALENFDAVGRFREEEGGRPIDATGGYQSRTGESIEFPGVRGLATFLAGSEEVRSAFVEQLFQYLVKQPVRAYGPNALANLEHSFEVNQYNMRRLVVEIAALSAGFEIERSPASQ
jgi:hypothetical protein